MPKTTRRQDESFAHTAIDGIQADIIKALRDVFERDSSWVLTWVADEFTPDEVFDEATLDEWAKQNGYVKE